MYRFKNSLIALVSLISFASIATVTLPHLGYGSNPIAAPTSQTQTVKVVNAPSEPVPVQGSVQATQSGAWNVGINGTPTVGINPSANTVRVDPTNPLAVRGDEPARTAFHARKIISLTFGQDTDIVAMVPLGKRLIIQHVSVSLELPSGQKPVGVKLSTAFDGNTGVEVHLVPTFVGTWVQRGSDNFAASEPVAQYAGAGTAVTLQVVRTSQVGDGFAEVSISGYLIDCGDGPGCPVP